jgi:hypothetical protein
MKLYFGVFLEKTPNHFGLGKSTVTKFLHKETALAWGKQRCEYGTERTVFEAEEEVINFLGQKGFPEKFTQKVLHFAEVNEEVRG